MLSQLKGLLAPYYPSYELVQRWCWLQYNNYTSLDYVIPYNTDDNYNYKDFINDFNYILKLNIKDDNNIILNLKKNISDYLKKSYKTYINLLHNEININLLIENLNDNIRFKILYNNYEIIKDINHFIEDYSIYGDSNEYKKLNSIKKTNSSRN
jgi:hypothetical protein